MWGDQVEVFVVMAWAKIATDGFPHNRIVLVFFEYGLVCLNMVLRR